ncbi:MAG TPA: citramalate synthase, partial [Thermodesulfovibrionales bacterium]|nr:citramalate synthase [Thermodesulfovibrionales bacterium]
MRRIEIYDTTLRDGSQAEEVSFSVEDKLRITEKLDEMGVHYVEGGWPGSNPKDADYFAKVGKLKLKHTQVVAFGSTRRPRKKPGRDETLRSLVEAATPVVTIFGKTWDFHVKEALKVPLEENLDIIHDSVAFLKRHAEKVFFDAEHF